VQRRVLTRAVAGFLHHEFIPRDGLGPRR
jgi:hypothetical protein